MRCLVTAGPTWEPLDQARRLTNFSTGRLGGELANALLLAGHEVQLFLSETATWNSSFAAIEVRTFSTSRSLAAALQYAATSASVAVFHAAAVSDFTGGEVFRRQPDNSLTPVKEGKLSTREPGLLLELRPTPKILPQLRDWFPAGRLTGWKYEVDGSRAGALTRGADQINASRTDACVVNGPAYGPGFGLLDSSGATRACTNRRELLTALIIGL